MKKILFDLNILHAFNDGFEGSFLLLVPFIAKDLGINLTQVGFLGTLLNVFSILLAIPAGFFAVKIGGMKTILLGFLLTSFGFLFASFSPTFLILTFAFVIGGIGYGVFHPIAFALVARITPKEKIGREIGNFTATGDIGKVAISAILTFIIVIIGWRFTAVGYALLGVLTLLVFIFLGKHNQSIVQEEDKNKTPISLLKILRDKSFVYASLTNMFDSFSSSSLYIFLPFLFLKKGISPTLLGSFTAAFFVGNLLGKTFLGRFVDTFGNTKVFIIAEILMAVFIFFLANTGNFFVIVGASILLGVFTKGTVPVTQTMISETAAHHKNFEKVFGINATTTSIATTISPLILGILSDKFGIVVSFNTMAIFAILATIPAFAFHYERKKMAALPILD